MSEPTSGPAGVDDVPPPVRRFLDRHADSLVLTDDCEPGSHPRVAVLGSPRSRSWPDGVRTTTIGLHGGTGAVALVPRPGWPVLLEVRSRRAGGGWWTVLRFAGQVDVAEVLAEVGRQSVWGDRFGDRGLRVGAHGRADADRAVPADVASLAPGPGGIGPFDENNDPSAAYIGIYKFDGDNKPVYQSAIQGAVKK